MKHGERELNNQETMNFMTWKKEETINSIWCNNKYMILNNIIKTLKITTECWNKPFNRLFSWQIWLRESAKKEISCKDNWLRAISLVRIYFSKMNNWTISSFWLKDKLWTYSLCQIKAFDWENLINTMILIIYDFFYLVEFILKLNEKISKINRINYW